MTVRTPEDLFTAGALRQAARAGVVGAEGNEAEALACRDAAWAEQEQERGFAAQLMTAKLFEWVAEVLGREVISSDLRQKGNLMLDAPLPGLGPLRELMRAGRHWIDHQPTSPQDDEHICGLQDAIDGAEDAYPFLATAPGSPPAEGGEG